MSGLDLGRQPKTKRTNQDLLLSGRICARAPGPFEHVNRSRSRKIRLMEITVLGLAKRCFIFFYGKFMLLIDSSMKNFVASHAS